jgi:hypothetical protein
MQKKLMSRVLRHSNPIGQEFPVGTQLSVQRPLSHAPLPQSLAIVQLVPSAPGEVI